MDDRKPMEDFSRIIQVAVPVPLRRHFDYLAPPGVKAGTRVLVPFGRRTMVGICIGCSLPETKRKLRRIQRILDDDPAVDDSLMELLLWSASYYHHPVGDVCQHALPPHLRQSRPLENPDLVMSFRRHPDIDDSSALQLLGRAHRQAGVYAAIPASGWVTIDTIRETLKTPDDQKDLKPFLKKLSDRGLIQCRETEIDETKRNPVALEGSLNQEQDAAVARVLESLGEFSTTVLHGITGSGKTEVYLHIAEQLIRQGKQVLVLVPEIALTPQLLERFESRLGRNVCTLHSGMADRRRYRNWWRARAGTAGVILGTRSAIFSPLSKPGAIIVDEEHDASFKQQEGFRYHARDLAIKRASMLGIPVLLGSATPSMETMENARNGKFALQPLRERTGKARLPEVELIDIRQFAAANRLSPPLISAIRNCMDENQQSVLFINRRGYAPITQCGECGWQDQCGRCDSYMTFHSDTGRMRCHYCGKTEKARESCPECGQKIFHSGAGTQRIESILQKQFPNARLLRFDRDEISNQEKLENALSEIQKGNVDLIIGTQLISKGHDFPGVTLVGVIDSDQGLYSMDFRAPEKLFQQLVQVAGRAGRSDQPGVVLIQTSHPENPYLQLIRDGDFDRFYQLCARERKGAGLPPYGHIALWRAESTAQSTALKFLELVRGIGHRITATEGISGVEIMDPVHSPMEKIAGRYRYQLLIRSARRKPMHDLLSRWIHAVEQSPLSSKVRWSIDIDPVDLY